MWNDRTFQINTLPPFLNGAILFQGPHKDIAWGTTISIETNLPSTIFVCIQSGDKDGDLPNTLPSQGWTLVAGTVNWAADSNLDQIWTKNVTTPQVVSYTTEKQVLVHAIFVKEGKTVQKSMNLLL